ncbi:hypothetical protein GCM10009105_04770 [Dokdonella soli]|uniref:Signal transduction histidine kinase internal region domain-containing protein n=2 Tax=Dokdonella soli TaxID=529810 RepID=A0ABP3TM49_9GAMM
MQTGNDEHPFDVTNDGTALAAIGLVAALVLWAVLFSAYRFDRADAVAVSAATVLLVVPPLVSYYWLMELTKSRLSLAPRILATYGLALVWLALQRAVIYPAFGFVPSMGESVTNFALIPLFGVASWFAVRGFLYRKRLARALELQAQTELRLLDAQLAPHALFNMLNTVYSVLLTDHEKAIPLFLAMSEALRHVIDRTRKRWIPLHDELDFIDHYAVLERARNPERVAITIKTNGDLDVPVPPMLLATLFENAVKHGRFPDGTLEINISVSVAETQMQFEVTNRFPVPEQAGRGMGIGQTNVRNRLHLLYPQKSAFRTHAEEGVYRATIDIAP